MKIIWKEVEEPECDCPKQVVLSEDTMRERKEKVISRMDEAGYDYLVIYCDLEHGANFEYLTGFVTRFEEALLIIGKDKTYLIAGNENVNKAEISRMPVEPILYPEFSLPNQPLKGKEKLEDIFGKIGIQDKRVGVAGWKLFEDVSLFDVPCWIVESLRQTAGRLENATEIFISPETGARITNNANEIAHYEYGASLASSGILKAMKSVREGISETELGTLLNGHGQRGSVVTIAAAGKRFEHAVIYPTEKIVKKGDALSLTVGYKGGLQSRAGFAAESGLDLPERQKGYLEELAIPYFKAVVTWLENIRTGMSGGMLYSMIEEVLPAGKFCWSLNPGHLCADEEWLASPVYKESEAVLKSGMILQFDIIPSVEGYAGVSCEGGIALADAGLPEKIKHSYPEKYETFMKRREYMRKILGIRVSDEILPMGNADAYYKPFMLSTKALAVERAAI